MPYLIDPLPKIVGCLCWVEMVGYQPGLMIIVNRVVKPIDQLFFRGGGQLGVDPQIACAAFQVLTGHPQVKSGEKQRIAEVPGQSVQPWFSGIAELVGNAANPAACERAGHLGIGDPGLPVGICQSLQFSGQRWGVDSITWDALDDGLLDGKTTEAPGPTTAPRRRLAAQKNEVGMLRGMGAQPVVLLPGNRLAERKGQDTSVKNWKNDTRCTKRPLSDQDRR